MPSFQSAYSDDSVSGSGAPPSSVDSAAPVVDSAEDARTERLALIEAFKSAFRSHPSGVAVITASTENGPVGLTASSVSSVSVEPPALSFSVTRATGSAGGLLTADTVLVHLLDSDHVALATSFSVSGAERFTPEQGWDTLPTGEPHLTSAAATLRCRPVHSYRIGGSTLVVAEVIGVVDTGRDSSSARPLVYRNREFHGLDGENTRLS